MVSLRSEAALGSEVFRITQHFPADPPQGKRHTIFPYHPGEARDRCSVRNAESTGDQLAWEVPEVRLCIYKPGTDAGALRNPRGQQFSCPAGKPREKHQHASALGWSQMRGGCIQALSKFRAFSQTSSPVHPAGISPLS